MIRLFMGISLREHIPNKTIRRRFGVIPIDEDMRENRPRWLGHVNRAAMESVPSPVYNLEMDGRRPKGRPKQPWQDTINTVSKPVI